MVILGIETSCDETGVGLVKDGCLAVNLIASQEKIHSVYGGVVPELASRAHLEYIDDLYLKVLKKSCLSDNDIDAIGVTNYPGLKGSLLIGVSFACALSYAIDVPIYAVNHLYAHIAANFFNPEIRFPAAGLVISGGHTTYFYMKNRVDFRVVGKTLDDACGETYDKVGRMLNLDFPGGPNVEQEALKGDEKRIKFPVPLLSRNSLDFSFSGLKTAVLYHIRKNGIADNVPDICAGFQKAVGDILCEKTRRVFRQYEPQSLLLGGGVIQNMYLRERLFKLAEDNGVRLFIPDKKLCMDNGAMVAMMASIFIEEGYASSERMIKVVPT
ncbi:MAG TPA: tRNA (adenosine(37)-N6)-threonylcarbamoyltransferase complex transferase subunit TsaD [bacterium]|nr:tRNA (adenosine(37)-N6)-threonylcarbamoyltransferase complex transferase subunit TsaD [bacterium]